MLKSSIYDSLRLKSVSRIRKDDIIRLSKHKPELVKLNEILKIELDNYIKRENEIKATPEKSEKQKGEELASILVDKNGKSISPENVSSDWLSTISVDRFNEYSFRLKGIHDSILKSIRELAPIKLTAIEIAGLLSKDTNWLQLAASPSGAFEK